jgi:pilus assembly protein Flp/PilA
MEAMYHHLAAFLRARFGDSERGASLVEYALLIALIAIVCFAAVTFLGTRTQAPINEIGTSLAGS